MKFKKNTEKRSFSWVPRDERPGIIGALVVSLLLLVWKAWSFIQLSSNGSNPHRFEHVVKDYGSYARLALFVVLAYYALLFIVKWQIWKKAGILKRWLRALIRIARRLHAPFAILAIALILLHVAAVFIEGFRYDFNHISGLLALLVLLPVPVSGLLRYKRLDRKWHLRSGIAFAVLFLIHAFL